MMSLVLNETLLFCIVGTLLNFQTNIPLNYVSIIAYCFQEDNLQRKHKDGSDEFKVEYIIFIS